MKQTSGPTKKAPAEAVLMDIRRVTKRQFAAEEKIRIVLEGLRGEESIAAARAGARASAARCSMAGPRSSWKPARRGSPATPPGRPRRTRSRTYVARPAP